VGSEQPQKISTGKETKEQDPSTEVDHVEEGKPAGNQLKVTEEKQDQPQEPEHVDDANRQAREEAETSQENAESQPSSKPENEVLDATPVADSIDVSAPADAKGPVDDDVFIPCYFMTYFPLSTIVSGVE